MATFSSNETIQSMVNVIVQCVSPLKIILFGSYARGEEKKGSDIDFIVIEDQQFGRGYSRRKEAAKIWQALMQFDVAKDILIYTTKEFNISKENPQSVIGQANKYGRVVYEKTS